MRLLWEYTSIDCTVHNSVCKTVYSENSLEFSILVKMLHNIFGHNTDYVIYLTLLSLADFRVAFGHLYESCCSQRHSKRTSGRLNELLTYLLKVARSSLGGG